VTRRFANVLVVGASRGIGLEFVRQCRAEGARVTATARDDAGLERLRALGATALPLDVASAAGASALALPIDGERFDLVLLNAGIMGPRKNGFEAPTQEEFDAVMHTNVLGPMRLLAQVQPALAPQAVLAFMSSNMGGLTRRSNAGSWLYRTSKTALNSVMRDASLVLAGQAICVSLHPGWVRTDMGGTQADLGVEESVSSLRCTLAALTPADNGRFLNHDGQPLPW
jgi:NAD(P)-dependent dehydrogenase (short-subunit alcohol dehydrogenase family)